MNIFSEVNNNVAIFLNSFVLENNLEKVIWFFSDTPIFFLPIFLLWFWFYFTFKNYNKSKKQDLLFIFYSVILAMIFNAIIKIFVTIDRPESIIKPILTHIPDKSFPSDHATVSFAFLFALFAAWYKKTFWLFLPFVLIMNLSRIAGWIHWFWDVIVGMILGLISVIIIFKNKRNIIFERLNYFILKIMKYMKL